MNKHLPETSSDILIYQTEDGQTRIDVRLEDGTVWLPQAALSELFQVTKQNISLHLKNIFSEGELFKDSVVKEYLTTATDGKSYRTKHYNLDAILAVGYRVRSHRGTQFRRWATELLNEYLVKGFVMDDERLKNIGTPFGADYFDELLERIRDIRASEKRFYRKITDIYATAVDYDSHSEPAQTFFQTVQNKLHWAVTGHTAAELIADRADAEKPNMGLTSWKGAKVRKLDVAVAKNYLSAEELDGLNRIVTMYLDYAEDQARRQRPMTMEEWAAKLDAFLSFNEREVLDHAGHVRAEVARQLAQAEYDKFNTWRLEEEAQGEDEFERAVKGIEQKGRNK
nr:virulence RhuM family protein [uncultured Desulfuromonas sp.]